MAREIPHKGGRTFGFRVSDDSATLAYLSDHCPTALGPGPDGLGEYHDAALALAAEADLLIHDAQYLDEELPGGPVSATPRRATRRTSRRGPARPDCCSSTTTLPAATTTSTPWWPLWPGVRWRWRAPPRAWSWTSPPL